MPKISKDYSKTFIYKIICKNKNIKDLYIGHTTNFNNRKHVHKCDSENETKNQKKLYQFINDNGGWVNWDMSIIEEINCNNNDEARAREKYWVNKLKATLNSKEPMFLSFDNEDFIPTTEDKTILNKEKTNFRQRKEREELIYLRNENKRLKQLLLENVLTKKLKNLS